MSSLHFQSRACEALPVETRAMSMVGQRERRNRFRRGETQFRLFQACGACICSSAFTHHPSQLLYTLPLEQVTSIHPTCIHSSLCCGASYGGEARGGLLRLHDKKPSLAAISILTTRLSGIDHPSGFIKHDRLLLPARRHHRGIDSTSEHEAVVLSNGARRA